MRRTSFAEMDCPIAATLERVGEWWSILILRDAAFGVRRFDDFQTGLGISPNSLTRRLTALVDAGLLARQRYQERPPRDEYVLTDRGRDFLPVLVALAGFGIRHFPPEHVALRLIDTETGRPARPVMIDETTGLPITDPRFAYVVTEPVEPNPAQE
jgi:DNA-binding HxlR family transcriptional regulator